MYNSHALSVFYIANLIERGEIPPLRREYENQSYSKRDLEEGHDR